MTVDTGNTVRVSTRGAPLSMIERVTLILDAFDGRAAQLTLEQVTNRSRLPRSTVHRILDSLVKMNWVEHAALGYRLGRRALGTDGGGTAEIREAAAPLLLQLHMQTNMVVHLSVLDGREAVYLDKVGGRLAISMPSRVGGRVQAHSTAGGKAMLAWLAPERVDALFTSRPDRCTENTITDLGTLHQELNRIRQRRGLAFERGESVRGMGCVASAIRGPEGAVAAVSLCSDARTAPLERVAPLVVDASREIARALYPELDNPRLAAQSSPVPEETWSGEVTARILARQRNGWI
ncbi:IclR family transcriptional regulator [Rhodococcus spelaei]|uniref:IclR family transcriptional regulator n=1 Tax=Rhodococcus spelaei TaxID=2546320 RepID=A0A541B7R8_9NOCA|nr:IclR family transcriptional regulator [Rhodococcus spelaei]TQF68366.1 IclR family transcriptional regulator [Rhodococcus spelaei]